METVKSKKVYIVGIEGAGTSALAQLYKNLGYEVSGSDNGDHFYGDILAKAGIEVHLDFKPENIPNNLDFAVHSTAFKDDNIEIQEIKRRNVPLYNYAQGLGEFYKQKKLGISVCGSHGKTTTTAMLASAMLEAETNPTSLVGSKVIDWNSNVLLGQSEYFVAEADEYQNKLQFYQPWSAILTSIDWDHPDFFPDFNSYKAVFKDFVAKIPQTGFLVIWGDSTDTLEVAKSANCRVVTYGFGQDCEYRVEHNQLEESEGRLFQTFEVLHKNQHIGKYRILLVGKHNVLNALSVVALTHAIGLDQAKISKALENFKGTTRRFEYIGKMEQALLIDDYAHHPDEIKATLAGAKEYFTDKKIWTVFHPHTFSRTKALMQDFAQSFEDTQKVIIIDTYSSAREHSMENTSDELAKQINRYQHDKAEYIGTMDEALEYITKKSGQFDVLITMGAGDVWKIAQKLKS